MASGISSELDGSRLELGLSDAYINLNYWKNVPEPKERLKVEVHNRKAQLKALGNVVVPQQIYPIFKAIIDISQYLTDK